MSALKQFFDSVKTRYLIMAPHTLMEMTWAAATKAAVAKFTSTNSASTPCYIWDGGGDACKLKCYKRCGKRPCSLIARRT